MPARRQHRPLGPEQTAYVQTHYRAGYGCIPIAEALSVGTARVRACIQALGLPRHRRGGDSTQRRLPPLPPFESAAAKVRRPRSFTPAGDIQAWNQPQRGWAVHDQGRPVRAAR